MLKNFNFVYSTRDRKLENLKMFLTNYSRYVLKSKLLSPSTFITTSALKEISNEPLQKSKAEANFGNKTESNVSSQEDSFRNEQSDAKNLEVCVSSDDKKQNETTLILKNGLMQGREQAEVLLNADPFEEVPGPEILKKISSVWKFLPEVGCQATVSAMLSYFNLTQKLATVAKLRKPESSPFDHLFRKYGPIVKLQGPLGSDIVLVCKPEHVAKIYNQEGKHPIRSTLDCVEKCRAQSRKSCGGPFNLSGIEWEEMRKALQEPLSKGGEVYFNSIHEAGDMFVKKIRCIRNKQNEVPEDFMLEITKWSMECLCCVTLGKPLGFHNIDLTLSLEPLRLLKAISDATQNICKCESGFQLWRFMNTPSLNALTQACEVIDTYISKYIRMAQINLTKKKDDLLSKDKENVQMPFIENLLLNECMAPEEVLTCIVDLLILGVNTTSSSLAFALYHLAQNHRSQRTLFKEVKEILPEKNSEIRFEQLSSFKYLDACLNESHRLRMPMPTLTRVLPNDIALSNYRIPRGTYMVMDVQTACLKEQNFEKSEKFFPERWLDPASIHPFSFIPYGHGSRSCLGKQLAEVQLKTCIAKIIRNYQLEYNYGEIQGTKTVISLPDRPLKLGFIEREE